MEAVLVDCILVIVRVVLEKLQDEHGKLKADDLPRQMELLRDEVMSSLDAILNKFEDGERRTQTRHKKKLLAPVRKLRYQVEDFIVAFQRTGRYDRHDLMTLVGKFRLLPISTYGLREELGNDKEKFLIYMWHQADVYGLAYAAQGFIEAFQRTGRYDHDCLMTLQHEFRRLRVLPKIISWIEERKARVIHEIDPGAECLVTSALLSGGIIYKKIKRTSALLGDIRTVILVHCTPADDQIEEQRKRCAAYSHKALLFAITTFVAYLGSASASTGSMAFKMTMASFIVAMPVDFISATRTPDWGIALVYLSCSLLVLVSYLLLISFNNKYGYAILPVPLPICIAFVIQRKQRPGRPRQLCNTESEADQDLDKDIEAGPCLNVDRSAQALGIHQNKDDEYANREDESSQALNTSNEREQNVNTKNDADQDLDGIFNLSAGIVNCGGFISIILGHYLVGPNQLMAVNAVGFLFFFTVVLGLYVMMVTTVRSAALTLHLSQLSFLLMALLMSTFVATMIYGVPRSEKASHV